MMPVSKFWRTCKSVNATLGNVSFDTSSMSLKTYFLIENSACCLPVIFEKAEIERFCSSM